MPKDMNKEQKKSYRKYLDLYNSYLSDDITPDQREQCKAEMVGIEKAFGIQGDWF
ncbi:hypothetical protein [Paenibacillus agricola]|uniref:Uncharacterized protein n=1 Tax=Paenibacillus agricola TaxID=2716264 RepID=A0ABX0JI10_9BACL|nr:hypothetical protein [Paenibacillus agricola]NHN33506.1 hypothetical protein [Paenibacillus agricola]